MSRRLGLYISNRTLVVPIYGAAGETVTLTHSDGTVYTAKTDSNGNAGSLEIKLGTYTVAGSVSGYSRTATVKKDTTMVAAFPDNTFFWHGYKGDVGGWTTSGYSNGNSPGVGTESSVGTSIYVKCTASDWYQQGWYSGTVIGSVNAIDVTSLKKIVFRASCNDANYGRVGITTTKGSCLSNGRNTAVGSGDYAIDVSDMTGDYYPFVSVTVYNYGTKYNSVTRIYGE